MNFITKSALETIALSAFLWCLFTLAFYMGGTVISDGCAPFLPAPLCETTTDQDITYKDPWQTPPSLNFRDSRFSVAGPPWGSEQHSFGHLDSLPHVKKK